jgi:hypothetical protein
MYGLVSVLSFDNHSLWKYSIEAHNQEGKAFYSLRHSFYGCPNGGLLEYLDHSKWEDV